MALDSWEIPRVVEIVLTGLVLFPALALSVFILSTPGARRDHTRRWVDFTKAALGLWSLSHLLSLVASIMLVVVASRERWWRSREYDAISYLSVISSLFNSGGQIAVLLALFYLAHALTQIRTGDEGDMSDAYRIGWKLVHGASILVALVALVVFALGIAVTAMIQNYLDPYHDIDRDAFWRVFNAQIYLSHSKTGILTIAAIAITVYAVMARKKASGSSVEKASTFLLVSASLWLVSLLWSVVYIIASRLIPFSEAIRYFGVMNVFFGIWPTLAAILVLYLLASNNAYGLSRMHFQVEDDEEPVL